MDDDVVSLSAAASYHGAGTVSYSESSLPTGLSLNSTTGLISGTIGNMDDVSQTAGPVAVTLTAIAGTYTVSETFDWEVDPRITFDDGDFDQTNVPGDTVSVAISGQDAPTATTTLTYSASGLPGGLTSTARRGRFRGRSRPR